MVELFRTERLSCVHFYVEQQHYLTQGCPAYSPRYPQGWFTDTGSERIQIGNSSGALPSAPLGSNDIIAAIRCTCNTRFGQNAQKYFGKFECTHPTVSASLHIIIQVFLMFTYLFFTFWRTVIDQERNTENNSI